MRQSKQVSILCDTNILIYYMLCTPRFIKDVMKLFERCVEREVKLSCASLSLKDVFYITPERFKERFMNDESMVVATTAKLILPEVAWSGISKLKELMTSCRLARRNVNWRSRCGTRITISRMTLLSPPHNNPGPPMW